MNNQCLWYGIVVELIIIGIELTTVAICVVVLTIIDYVKKSYGKPQTNDEKPTANNTVIQSNDNIVVSLETDLQMATGKID